MAFATKPSALQSLVTFRNSQGEVARGTLLRLERSTVVFEVYNPYSIVQVSEVLQEVTIRRGDRSIYQGRAVVSNLVNTGLMLIVSASLVDVWETPVQLLGDAALFRQEAAQFIEQWIFSNSINDDYRVSVGKLRSFLIELNQWLEQVEAHSAGSNNVDCATYDSLLDLAAPLVAKLGELTEGFETAAVHVEPSAAGVHKAYFQREIHPLVMRAPFVHRTYYKPLGYAGDYEMMNMIYRDEPEGPSVYAKLINALYVRLPIALSVRNRARTLENYLKQGAEKKLGTGRPFCAMSVGCGPALEVQRFVKNERLSSSCVLSLLDFNEETLAYAREKVLDAATVSGNRSEICFYQESVHSLLKSAVTPNSEPSHRDLDFVYCAGLFDYLSDRVCSRLLRLFYSWLAPGGVMLVTNMHVRNPHRFLLEHGAEWYLIHRDEAQMERLIPGVGMQRTYTDDTGINLSLEVQRIGKETTRLH